MTPTPSPSSPLASALKAAEKALATAISEDGDISCEAVQDALALALTTIWEAQQGADPGQPAAGLDLDAASTDLAVRLLKYGWAKRHISARDLGAAIANHFRAVMAPIPAAPAAPVNLDYPIYKLHELRREAEEDHAMGRTIGSAHVAVETRLIADILEKLQGAAAHPGSASTGEASHG